MTSLSSSRLRFAGRALLLAVPIVAAIAAGCSSATSSASDAAPATTAAPDDVVLQAGDFVSLKDMTPVRGFFLANRLGHLDEALAVANDPEGGEYPGRHAHPARAAGGDGQAGPGFDAGSDDWEFFFLDVSSTGTTILTRGGAEVVNRFGGSCSSCHSAADPKFDFVCEKDHGCEPLPIGDDVIHAIQQADPRPV